MHEVLLRRLVLISFLQRREHDYRYVDPFLRSFIKIAIDRAKDYTLLKNIERCDHADINNLSHQRFIIIKEMGFRFYDIHASYRSGVNRFDVAFALASKYEGVCPYCIILLIRICIHGYFMYQWLVV